MKFIMFLLERICHKLNNFGVLFKAIECGLLYTFMYYNMLYISNNVRIVMIKMDKIIKFIVLIVSILILIVFIINFYVIFTTKDKIVESDDLKSILDIDCILVLGAGVWGDRPSPMLEDRIKTGIELYNLGLASKILMSGDHGNIDYDEVNTMKDYAINKDIPSSDIFMDHAGFSTYDSIYRVKEIFKAKKIVIVTQEYHLYRALYIAKSLGIEAYGVDSTFRIYTKETYREIREILARNKDFVKVIFKPKSTYLGNKINLDGNGDITNDK